MLIFDWEAQKTCFGHVLSKKNFFYHRGDPNIEKNRKNSKKPKMLILDWEAQKTYFGHVLSKKNFFLPQGGP